MEGPNNSAVAFRIFDKNNYWTDPSTVDFGSSSKAVFDLSNLVSTENRKLDPSHIYFVGFWSLGNATFKIRKVYLSDNPDGESGLNVITVAPEARAVDVYTLQGVRLKTQVAPEQATAGLYPGIYIVGGKKVMVGENL